MDIKKDIIEDLDKLDKKELANLYKLIRAMLTSNKGIIKANLNRFLK